MKMTLTLFAATGLALLASPALAKDAHCYTTDDGEYDCWFVALDGNGSFEISADSLPTYRVWIDAPGVASVGAVFEAGGRSVPLPGPHYRSDQDGACWVSAATETEICAW